MTDDERTKRLAEEAHRLLWGNEKYGESGLKQRVEDTESYIEEERRKSYITLEEAEERMFSKQDAEDLKMLTRIGRLIWPYLKKIGWAMAVAVAGIIANAIQNIFWGA